MSIAMANCEPHGFVFDHVGHQPSSSRPIRSPGAEPGRSPRSRSSFRVSSLRSALFTPKNGRDGGRKHAGGSSVDKTPTSGVFSSLFGRQADSKSPPGGDLWVDVDLHRPASPSLDNLSVTSSDWTAVDTPWSPDEDRSATDVAVVRRSNSARPATRRPLPMRVSDTTETVSPVCVRDTDLWTRGVNSPNNARLSGDSGHVSCKPKCFYRATLC